MNVSQSQTSRAPRRLGRSAQTEAGPTPAVESAGKRRSEAIITSQLSRAWLYGAIAMVVLGAILQNGALFSLGLLLAAALGVAWLWTNWCLKRLSVERRFSHSRAFWGEEVDVAQVFTNVKPMPVPWLAVEDRFPGSLPVLSQEVLHNPKAPIKELNTTVSLGLYERVTRHYTIKCVARGEHDFGPIEVRSGDIFGLFRRAELFDTPQTLLIYPRYVPVERLGIPARQPFGDFKAVLNLATDPLKMRGVREYAYGDNPRFMHWKATARRGELQTKLFEPAATPQLFIFCNQDTFRRMWEGIDTATLELTITVAASVANHALQEGYMVGLQANAFTASSDVQLKITPSRSPDQLTRILESLARLRGWSGLPMENLMEAQRRNLPIAATIVLVTGVVTEEMLDLLTALRRAGHPVTLIETIGSARPAKLEGYASPDALQAQGITYYRVEAVDNIVDIEQIAL